MKDKIKEKLLKEIENKKIKARNRFNEICKDLKKTYSNKDYKKYSLEDDKCLWEIEEAKLQQHEETKKAERERFKKIIDNLKKKVISEHKKTDRERVRAMSSLQLFDMDKDCFINYLKELEDLKND